MRSLSLAILVALGTTAGASNRAAQTIEAAADEAGVPTELVMAIAVEEGGLALAPSRVIQADDPVPVAGALELRHGRLDTLALGARLQGTTEAALRSDTDLGTRAGARVLASLGANTGARNDDLATWRPALEAMSGMDDASAHAYADRVFAILRVGGRFPARGGEVVAISAHAALPATIAAPVIPAGTPDYAGAQWFTTSCTDKCTVGRPLGNAAVDKIVIHDTEGGWDGSVATLQNDSGKSVHYIVDADGSRVGQFRPETDTTWHAGNYYYNETSIGIEHVGVASDPDGYASGLYATSRALVQDIRTRWTVPIDREHIIGHYQVPNGNNVSEQAAPCTDTLDACETSANYGGAGNHRDPGYHWQWCQYMHALGGTCTCNDAYPLWNCTTDLTEAYRCANGEVQIEECTACDVMPVGTEDVCHVAPSAPDAGSGRSGDTVDGGTVDGGPGPSGGGCCNTGRGADGGTTALVGLLAIVVLRRRRR